MGLKEKYNHRKVESYWQSRWLKEKIYLPLRMIDIKNKFYNLWMFPYPSAEGLHAGHAFASTGSDVYGRYMRMSGKDVFQPIGYDSFGIHSENFALKIGEHPEIMLKRTTLNYERQLKSLGHGYDWTRTVTTSTENYYIWTQWLFIQLFKSGLAYRGKSSVNWCPSCKTVLADEQVMSPIQAGKIPKGYKSFKDLPENLKVCERCGNIVEIKVLKEWHFNITSYADRLLEGLDKIKWPEKIKIAQRNWIGRKEGITIRYNIKGIKESVCCWTSRPETNFGATFIVISPEHHLVSLLLKLKIKVQKNILINIKKYIKMIKNKTKEERISEGRKKTGIFTGLYAINQLNNKEMPIWISDFVLTDVGTGAVVGVPGHDKRDFEFAKEFNLPIIRVVVGKDNDKSDINEVSKVQENEGIMINSEFLDGLNINKASEMMTEYLESKGMGKRETKYHLRDWIISRQRYWGCPIPMIYCKNCASKTKSWFNTKEAEDYLYKINQNTQNSDNWVLRAKELNKKMAGWYPEKNLPVKLPFIKDYQPEGTGKGPLANHPEFYKTKCPECNSLAQRETDVSDTFLDSSWYFLRYPSVKSIKSKTKPFDINITKRWLPVDLYFGGAEHAVLHLMYSRFITMVLYDLEYINFEEPFPWFFAHGLMIKDGAKMSKSRGNVVNPDDYIEKFGSDTLRLYLMFMGPMDGYPDFRDTGIEGMRRFIQKIWNLFNSSNKSLSRPVLNKELVIKMHKTVKKVTKDVEDFKYNTAIASIMEFVNELKIGLETTQINFRETRSNNNLNDKLKGTTDFKLNWLEVMKNLSLLLSPFAPHITEEIWVNILKQPFSIHKSAWPKYNPELIQEIKVTIAVQVNGKLRGTISIDRVASLDKKKVIEIALKQNNVSKWLKNENINNFIFIPGKLLNLVTD